MLVQELTLIHVMNVIQFVQMVMIEYVFHHGILKMVVLKIVQIIEEFVMLKIDLTLSQDQVVTYILEQ